MKRSTILLLLCYLSLSPLSQSSAEESTPVVEKQQVVIATLDTHVKAASSAKASTIQKQNITSYSSNESMVPEPPQADISSEDTNSTQEKTASNIQQQNELIKKLIKKQEELVDEVSELKEAKNDSGYSTWVSILLACVAILVTVLGVVIALISFVGYKNIKENTKEAAEKISTETASYVAKEEAQKQINEVAQKELARLIDEGQLSSHLESAVDVIMRRHGTTPSGVGGFSKYPELDEMGED